nr:MAG TPA: hypothetical protein [Caudoviricetes sp.]
MFVLLTVYYHSCFILSTILFYIFKFFSLFSVYI